MATQFIGMIAEIAATIVGLLIGAGFGVVQDSARRRYEKKQQEGNFKSGWSIIPGSGARIAYLLISLVLIQVICPLLFKDGIQWWVSGGVAAGYGIMLFRQLRQRMSGNK